MKPGGWVQFVEAEHTCDEDDGLAMRQFLKLMKAIFNMMGAAMKFHEEMEGWLKEEGFVNVGKKVVQIGFGVKCTDEKLVGQSVQAFGSAAAALVEFGKSMVPFSFILALVFPSLKRSE